MRTWLVIAAGADRQHAGNTGYDDDPSSYYSWDETVPNRWGPKKGDTIAVWDKKSLLGVSIIENILEGSQEKPRYRCPLCMRTNIKRRKTRKPEYKCNTSSCSRAFDTPLEELIRVHTYRSMHQSAWVDLSGSIEGAELRTLCLDAKCVFQ